MSTEQKQSRGGFSAGAEKREGAPQGGRGGRGRGPAKDVWTPSTKLGRLVQAKKNQIN